MRQFYLFPRIPLTELEISIFRVGRFLLFLNALSSGFSFLRNRNTWDIIIAIQENDTGIISQRNCFERIEKNRTRLFVDSLSTSFRYSFSIDVAIDSFIENSINSNCSIIKY